MISPDAKCANVFTPPYSEEVQTCGHRYAEHATDLNHTEEHCWHGAIIGESCQCPAFKEAK